MSRRRLYLMRHGSVDYFDAEGHPVPPDAVRLNDDGCIQADAAGDAFAAAGVRFDLAVHTGLARTRETCARVLARCAPSLQPEVIEALREVRAGRLADLPDDGLERTFLEAFAAPGGLDRRFLGGETIGALVQRAAPAFRSLLSRTDWSEALVVAHGGTNIACLSTLLAGAPAFLGGLEQSAGAINAIDVGDDGTAIVRLVNLRPGDPLQHAERATTMERVWAHYARSRRADGTRA